MRNPRSEIITSSAEIQVNRRAVARIRSGHPWIYRSDLLTAESIAEPGSLVHVADELSRLLGSALYSSTSHIALRTVSSSAVSQDALPQLVSHLVSAA